MGLKARPASTPSDGPGRRSPAAPGPRPPRAPRFEEHLARLPRLQRAITDHLRTQVQRAAPDAIEGIRWGMIHYAYRGNLLYIDATRDHVKLGFFRGVDLADPEGRLEGSGKKLRHLKLHDPVEAGWDRVGPLLRQAYELAAAR